MFQEINLIVKYNLCLSELLKCRYDHCTAQLNIQRGLHPAGYNGERGSLRMFKTIWFLLVRLWKLSSAVKYDSYQSNPNSIFSLSKRNPFSKTELKFVTI